ncbi:hypothetical protein CEXT_471341 [Caerostris extrusa]|uniref:Uncharacterized protein n=1 Tax=Caerostris extrusa TaxID=172846 RepID=A0AAV4Y8Y3_CAEEX|nr:hypothetical protein CEXT_471341 [Caerostris extrusa]
MAHDRYQKEKKAEGHGSNCERNTSIPLSLFAETAIPRRIKAVITFPKVIVRQKTISVISPHIHRLSVASSATIRKKSSRPSLTSGDTLLLTFPPGSSSHPYFWNYTFLHIMTNRGICGDEGEWEKKMTSCYISTIVMKVFSKNCFH